MVESLETTILLDTLEQDVRAKDVVFGEGIRVTKTQIHMRVGREVEDGVDAVIPEALQHVAWPCYIAVEEAEIWLRLQHARIVQRAAVIQLVEGYDVVMVGILDCQVAHQPRATVLFLAQSAAAISRLALFRPGVRELAYMKPSPPVTRMFFTPVSGCHCVCPVRIGASRQMP